VKQFAARLAHAARVSADPRAIALVAFAGTRLMRDPGDRTGRFRFRGASFEGRAADWCAIEEVLVTREYRFVIPLLARYAAPSVVDVGANIGTFALFVLANHPGAEVVSLEPSAATYAILERNSHMQRGRTWTVRKSAVSSERGTARFSNAAVSSSSRLGIDGDELVDTITIEDALGLGRHPVDLLKVDVEGAEADALAGRHGALVDVRHVIVELHPGRCDTDAVVDTLRRRYRNILEVPGRASTKPLLLATDDDVAMPAYQPR